jgi:Uncharacterized protein conserved in bacteria (DUF2188)
MKKSKLMPKKKRPLIRPQEAGELDPEEIRAVVRAVHVLPTVDAWEVRKGGKKRISVLFETQEDAEKYAHQLSVDQSVGIVVHSQIIPKLQFRGTLANNKVGVATGLSQDGQGRIRKPSVNQDVGVVKHPEILSKFEK